MVKASGITHTPVHFHQGWTGPNEVSLRHLVIVIIKEKKKEKEEDKSLGDADGSTHWYKANSLCSQRMLELIPKCNI